jgi:hypothetical protein
MFLLRGGNADAEGFLSHTPHPVFIDSLGAPSTDISSVHMVLPSFLGSLLKLSERYGVCHEQPINAKRIRC